MCDVIDDGDHVRTDRVEEAEQELRDRQVMLRKTFDDALTPVDPQAALHTWGGEGGTRHSGHSSPTHDFMSRDHTHPAAPGPVRTL